jgi:hypothetical protein
VLVRRVLLLTALAGVFAAAACADVAGIEDPQPAPKKHLAPDAGVVEIVAGVTVTSGVEFSAVECGAPARASVIITNNSGSAVAFTGSLPDDADPAHPTFAFPDAHGPTIDGTLESGKDTTLTIQAMSSLPGKHTTALDVRIGSASQKVTLGVTVNGAILAAEPLLIDFGDLPINTSSTPRSIELRNDGNESLSIDALRDDKQNFYFDPNSTIDLPAGGKATVNVTMAAGSTTGPVALDSKLAQTSGTKCKDEPVLSLKGQRVAADAGAQP